MFVTIQSPQFLPLDGEGLSGDEIKHHPSLTPPLEGGGMNGYTCFRDLFFQNENRCNVND